MKALLLAACAATLAFASPARADSVCRGSEHEITLHTDASGKVTGATVREYRAFTSQYGRCRSTRGNGAVLECTEQYIETDWVTVYADGSASWDHSYNAEPSEGPHLKCR